MLNPGKIFCWKYQCRVIEELQKILNSVKWGCMKNLKKVKRKDLNKKHEGQSHWGQEGHQKWHLDTMQCGGVIVIKPQTEQAQKQYPKNLTFLAYKHGHRLTEKYL